MMILGIDIGTSAIKAAIVEVPTMELIGPVANVGYEIDHPTPDAAEVPAQRLWNSIVQAVRAATHGHSSMVEGVGLSVLTPALCLMDRFDQPIGSFWIHADRRSRPQAHRVLAEVGEEFLSTVGTRPLPGGISALSWACRRESEPRIETQVRRYLHVNGWAALRLTGESAFDPANASFSGLFGTLTDQQWSKRWCRYFQIDPKWLPEIKCGTTTVGQLRSQVAVELGISAGIPVKLGTADTTCGMIAGRVQPGELYHTVGTTQVLATLTDEPRPHSNRLTRHFGIGSLFLQVTHNPVGGAALEWFRQLCYSEVAPELFFTQVIPSLILRSTAVRLDPPYLGGDRLQIDEVCAGFKYLSLNHCRDDLLAAVLAALREHHQMAVADLGMSENFRRVTLSGGAASVVRQLIPDYQQSNVELLVEGAVRGAAGLFA